MTPDNKKKQCHTHGIISRKMVKMPKTRRNESSNCATNLQCCSEI